MSRTPTLVHATSSLPFPLRITLLLVPPGRHLSRGTNILYYEYSSHGVELEPGASSRRGETRTGAWECPVEGEVVRWRVGKGDVVKDATKPIVEILEPCRHEEQVNGLCLICLKDVSGVDYSGFSDASRATVAMVHDAASITVSPEVAARLEHESATRLLGARKLSLVVDLDQTIIQATVDPTVGEWIDQGRAWEEGREGARKNPNWEALTDVGRFRLSEERKAVNGRAGRGVGAQRGRREDTTYYIKPRPGLHAFLTRLAELYEMHVYTMGTRSYASQVVRLIDPTGHLFGSRVLSRDESGSLQFKNLTRLFPCNTGSAVIIDDRADVWELSRANLVKVVPYDFFSVGDINGTFLPTPQANPLLPASGPGPTPASSVPSSGTPDEPQADLIPTVALALEEAEESEAEEKQKAAMERLQEQRLTKDKESRPLQKLMDELEARERSERARSREGSERSRSSSREREGAQKGEEEEVSTVQEANGHALESSESPTTTVVGGEVDEEPIVERALLTNDDHELQRVLRILEEIHRRYFQQYELYAADKHSRKEPSVMEIIPEMKASVLSGVHLVFSSLIPIDMPPQNTDLWRQALQFGAACYTKVTREVTHVVAAKRGTEKVRQALAKGCSIVNPYWFLDSVAAWERKREEEYPLEGLESSTTPPIKAGETADDGAVTHPNSPPSLNGKDESRAPSENGSERAVPRVEGEEEDLGEDVDLGELDWNEMDAELEDLMDEDDEDEDGQDGDYPEEPEDDSQASHVATVGKKRRRTGSAVGTPAGSDDEEPSLKRARRRTSGSSLKGRANEEILEASQLVDDEDDNGHDVADDDDGDDDFDFLARDLEGMEDEPEEDEGDDDGGTAE
ncbi:hypothetical protein CALVIDRAFT_296481 [Calocera viscosa TUFC12733]|uniref:RNA polymerase II subunit A C-terminal domain phosphatase n=1 Tax=Calocera viscosa (strain TUFC12733) TaxID=1330018 RepID=A0A167IN06_CALVF|nr:hypothetical protein CALVIDRAFT_296481 [Calocera viscosa TUFC12733]